MADCRWATARARTLARPTRGSGCRPGIGRSARGLRLCCALYGQRSTLWPILRPAQPVRGRDADADTGRGPADAVHRLGAGRPVLIPVDWLLVRAAGGAS